MKGLTATARTWHKIGADGGLSRPGSGDAAMKVLKMKFGTGGEAADAFGIRFYGDMAGEIGRLGRIGEMFSNPGASPMIRHRRITLWFTFQRIRPYE